MKKSIYLLLIGSFILSVSSSCTKEKLVPSCDGSTPTFEGEMETILFANCSNTSSCHGTGASKRKGELMTYEDYVEVLEDGSFQKTVLEKQNMPKKATLLQKDIDLIQCWVNNGYPEK